MKTTTKPLREAFSLVQKLATGRTTLPILSSVLLEAKDGRLSITANNLDCMAVSRCDCEGDLPPIAVPAFALGALLQSGEDCPITLELLPNQRLSIKARNAATIPVLVGEDFPTMIPDKPEAFGVNGDDLATAIESVKWARYSQPDRPALQCVNVICRPKEIFAVASTGRLLAAISTPSIADKCEFTLVEEYASYICEALRLPNSTLHLANNVVMVKSPDFDVTVKRIEEKYPPVKNVIDQPVSDIGVVDKAALMDALSTAMLLAKNTPDANGDGGFAPIHLTFNKTSLDIEYSADNSLAASIDGKFKPWKCRINAFLLHKCLSSCNAPAPMLMMEDSQDGIRLKHDGYTVILRCLREVEKKETKK